MRTKIRLLCYSTLALFLCAGWCYAQPDAVIQATEKAWKQREERLKSVRIEWEEEITHFKGGRTDTLGTLTKDGKPFPPDDRRYTEYSTITLEEDKIRHDYRGRALNMAKEDWVGESQYTAIYDGKTGIAIQDQPNSKLNLALKQSENPPHQIKSIGLIPVLLTMRPVNHNFSIVDLSEYRSTGRKQIIHERECLELAWQSKSSNGGGQTIWVDPKRDYVVARILINFAKGSPRAAIQTDIEYQEPKPGVWVPKGWISQKQGWKMPLTNKNVATVTKTEIDIDLPESTFSTEPPPATIVAEVNNNQNSEYVVNASGKRTEITSANQSQAPALALATDKPGSWISRNILLIGAAVVGLALALFFGYRRNQRLVLKLAK